MALSRETDPSLGWGLSWVPCSDAIPERGPTAQGCGGTAPQLSQPLVLAPQSRGRTNDRQCFPLCQSP